MKEHFRNNWAMYAIIVVIGVIILFFAIYDRQTSYANTAACSINDDALTYTYEISGNDNLIEHITIRMERELEEELSEEDLQTAAMNMAGEKIAYIVDSEAVKTTFYQYEKKLTVEISIQTSELVSSDYEYLNANGFILIGTINWKTASIENLETVLSQEGYICN